GDEAHVLSVHDAERLAQAGRAWCWTATTDLVERLRAAKDEGEVAAIRSAAMLAGDALRETLPQGRAGMTERAIAGAPEGAARRRRRTALAAGRGGGGAAALPRGPTPAPGFEEAFGHSLGHGLGLELHEAPRLSKTNADPLPAGAVVTVEPGVYVAGEGGVRIEDDVHLPDGRGAELLSDGLTDLVELVELRTLTPYTRNHEPRQHRARRA